MPRVTLRLVGGGPDIDALRQLARDLGIAERCEWVGRVARADVSAHFAQATLSVDPVLDDDTARARWPLKIVESLAAGVPVVTGDIGDRRELLGLLDGDLARGRGRCRRARWGRWPRRCTRCWSSQRGWRPCAPVAGRRRSAIAARR